MNLKQVTSVISVVLIISIFAISGITILIHSFPHSSHEYMEVTVDYGDTLWTIAQTIAPHSDPREVVWQIQEENQISGANIIYPGQTIRVPNYQASL